MIMNSTLGRLPSSGAFGVRRNREEKGEKMDRKTKQTLYRSFHLVHGARAALGGIPLQVVEVLLLVAMEEGIRGERFVAELLEASIAGRRVRSYEPPKESTA